MLPGTTVQVPVLSGVRHLEVSNGGRGAVDVVVNERQDLLTVAVRDEGAKSADEGVATDREIEAIRVAVTALAPLTAAQRGRALNYTISYLWQYGKIEGLDAR